jgi:hypothetical protein
MSGTRDVVTPDKTDKQPELIVPKAANDVFVAASATACTQPTRMLSTYSCIYTSVFQTFKNAIPNLFNGLHINILRGGFMTGSQLFAKDIGQETAGFAGSIFAVAFSGASIATALETPLIRKSLNAESLHRFTLSLFFLYAMRETTVGLGVLVKNNLSPMQKDGVLALCGAATAGLQKFITVDAARDTLKKGITAPDFSQGIIKTFRAMGNGEYNHPAFQVPFPSPKGKMGKMSNILYQVSGGPNVIAFRILHLFIFREALSFAANNFTINNAHGFFNTTVKKEMNTLQTKIKESSLEIQKRFGNNT